MEFGFCCRGIRQWSYGDLVFIVDPYLWLILGGASFLLTCKDEVAEIHLGSNGRGTHVSGRRKSAQQLVCPILR